MQDAITHSVNKVDLGKLKICHVITSLSVIGGAQRVLVRMLLADPDSVDQKMVLVLRHAGVWGDQLRSAGVIVHELGMDSAVHAPGALYRLMKIMKAFNPDIVQTWMYHADFLGGLAAWIVGCKNIVWGIHRTSLSASDSKITILLMKSCALMSHWLPKKIIHVAKAGKKAHIEAGYNAERIVVIPNGFDFSGLTATAEQRKTFRDNCKFKDDEMVIGCLARFHNAKGHDNFVNAAAIVAKSYPKTKFMIAGTDCDANNTKLNGWINQHNLQDSFVLLGERHDVPNCLSAMDIFCMPSRTEAFPIALGEAMAMGLPCVATNVGDTEVLAGDTAVLVPAQDPEALARGLLEVIGLTEKQRNQMGQRAKDRVIAEFSIDKACQHYNAVYREIIA